MNVIERIKSEIDKIKQRNSKVEIDKAWEVSKTRKVVIALLTYFVVVLFFYFAGLPKPFVNSIVPTLGFVLSTLSLDFFKRAWVKYIYKK
ncbi:hypothetical protein BVX95_00255 [archaeon D22]|nr:hypothetical protein BVX95_00255 [archaeon D22]